MFRVEALAATRQKELQEAPGGQQMSFQQVLKSVLLKKVFSELHRKEMAALAQKYAVGMTIAAQRHSLPKECLDAFAARFVLGDFDNELLKPPSL